jgi:hypothetical protein
MALKRPIDDLAKASSHEPCSAQRMHARDSEHARVYRIGQLLTANVEGNRAADEMQTEDQGMCRRSG